MLNEVGAYVDAQTALTLGTDLWLAQMPDTPDTAVCIYVTPGQEVRDFLGGDTKGIERPSLQVLSRAPTYAVAEQNAFSVWSVLRAVVDATLSGVYYLRIRPNQSPFSLGYDDNRLARVAFNAIVERQLP